MNKTLLAVLALCGLVGITMGNSAVTGDEPAMMASPNVVILAAPVVDITVHTNIPASEVASGTVTLNEVAPTGVGVDRCGHLVAKFAIASLALTKGEAELTLCGLYADGSGGFCATDVVTVK